MAWQVRAWLGKAWHGRARLGAARHGMAWETRCVYGHTGHFSLKVQSRLGKAGRGPAWLGKARQGVARRGSAGQGKAWETPAGDTAGAFFMPSTESNYLATRGVLHHNRQYDVHTTRSILSLPDSTLLSVSVFPGVGVSGNGW